MQTERPTAEQQFGIMHYALLRLTLVIAAFLLVYTEIRQVLRANIIDLQAWILTKGPSRRPRWMVPHRWRRRPEHSMMLVHPEERWSVLSRIDSYSVRHCGPL